MSKARVQTRNLMINWFGHGANLAVMFFLSPFIIHSLGKVDYGVWSLLVAVTGYMGLMDVGIRASTGRFVIFHAGRDEHDLVNETIQNALGFFTALVMVLVIAAGVLGGGSRRYSTCIRPPGRWRRRYFRFWRSTFG